jgi:hypothetical protein
VDEQGTDKNKLDMVQFYGKESKWKIRVSLRRCLKFFSLIGKLNGLQTDGKLAAILLLLLFTPCRWVSLRGYITFPCWRSVWVRSGNSLINYGNIKLKISANVYQPRFQNVVKDAVPPEK